MKQTAIGIFGPTASGKSAVALAVARELDGEIISCDSMQVYRGLNIGTAKPTAAEQAAVRHHLVDILDIGERFDVEAFAGLAEVAIRDIIAREKLPIVCGGTGFYARKLFYGEVVPPCDAEVRRQVELDLERLGHAALLAELEAIDPASARRVEDNSRRLVRALEIVRLTRKPVPLLEAVPPEYAGRQIILIPDPAITRRRIEARTRLMLEAGWVEETANLLGMGLLQSPTAGQALGYPEIAEWLVNGGRDREALVEKLVTRTARYAKRQRTWFRHQHPGAIVLELKGNYQSSEVAARVLSLLAG